MALGFSAVPGFDRAMGSYRSSYRRRTVHSPPARSLPFPALHRVMAGRGTRRTGPVGADAAKGPELTSSKARMQGHPPANFRRRGDRSADSPRWTCHAKHGMLDHDPVMAGRKHEALRRDRQEQVARHGRRNCQGAPSGIAWLTGGRSGRWAMTINGPGVSSFASRTATRSTSRSSTIIEGARSWFSSKFTPAAS